VIRKLVLYPGSSGRPDKWHLEGQFLPPTAAWFEFTISTDELAPVINISAWSQGSTLYYSAQDAVLRARIPSWIGSLERILAPYRTGLFERGRFAGTPYSLRKLVIDPHATISNNWPMRSRAWVSLSLAGLPGSGLRQIALLAVTPAAKNGFRLWRAARWNRDTYEAGGEVRFPEANKIGQRLPVLAQIIEPGTARGEEIAIALHSAMPAAASLIDGIAKLF
jgi:hypothetical protein